jgi:hypothetical protein
MKYIVLRDCHGFKNRYWRKGQVVTVNDSDKFSVPKHFEPIDRDPEVVNESPYSPVPISKLRNHEEAKGGLAQAVAPQILDNKTLQPKRGRPKKDS